MDFWDKAVATAQDIQNPYGFWNQTVQTAQNVTNPDALTAQVAAQNKAAKPAIGISTIALVGVAALVVYLLVRKK